MRKLFILLFFVPGLIFAEGMYSPTWGFFIDLPEGYEYVDGDARDRFSFSGPDDVMFDLVVYNGNYASINDLVSDVNRRLGNRGEIDFFRYHDKEASVIKLTFGNYDGWGLAVEIDGGSGGSRPLLLALAYGPADRADLEILHISALDSIAPSAAERRYPGPLIEYSYPRGAARSVTLASGISVLIRENDAQASQDLIEREYAIFNAYLNTPYLQKACTRYYRFIYRDSYDRIADAASAIARSLGGNTAFSDAEKREFAQRVLTFVQGFRYERDLSGSDFVNLVSAITEGRGDCDSRAMLFSVILAKSNIRSAFMLSFHYSHAMGLADVTGTGARFELFETMWLVAETTARIEIGLIDQDLSDPQYWFGVMFEE